MASELRGKTIAILAADGVEQVELEQPRRAVQTAGAVTELLSIKQGEIQAVNSDIHPSVTFTVDRLVGEASAGDYDALILPGGAVNPDNLRQHPDLLPERQNRHPQRRRQCRRPGGGHRPKHHLQPLAGRPAGLLCPDRRAVCRGPNGDGPGRRLKLNRARTVRAAVGGSGPMTRKDLDEQQE
jgi:DJ-1/PfpI family